ncbi:hypothetical protein [Endothiovibrio diazotrophicus]
MLAFPVLCAVVLQSIRVGGVDFILAGYGLSFLFFGVAAFSGMACQRR